MEALLALVLTGLALSVGAVQKHSIRLVDSAHGAYLTGQQAASAFSQQELQGLVSAVTGLLPGRSIDGIQNQLLSELVQATLQKPRVHVMLNLAGWNAEDVQALFGERQQVPAQLEEGEAHVAYAVLELLAGLAEANPGVNILSADDMAAQACSEQHCLQSMLTDVAGIVGGQHSDSSLTLDGTVLDLQQLADRVFASELASMYSGVQEQVKRASSAQDVQVMEMTMLGLQGLADSYGADAQEVAVAKAAMQQLLSWSVQQLDTALGGDVTFQVATFDTAPVPSASVDGALVWKSHARSRMLQASANTTTTTPSWLANEDESAKIFAAKAAAYGGFILLLYFLLGATYCLCNMPLIHDTLLFGSKPKSS